MEDELIPAINDDEDIPDGLLFDTVPDWESRVLLMGEGFGSMLICPLALTGCVTGVGFGSMPRRLTTLTGRGSGVGFGVRPTGDVSGVEAASAATAALVADSTRRRSMDSIPGLQARAMERRT